MSRRLGQYPAFAGRFENGQIVFTAELLEQVASAMGVPNGQLSKWLDALAEIGTSPWTPSVGAPEQAANLMSYEREAIRISEVFGYIPGLLQTEETARAIFATDEDADIDDLVTVRMARQAVLRRRNPPTYLAFLEEHALRRHFGGHEAAARQISALVEAADVPHVTTRVIPEARGPYFGMATPFTHLAFDGADAIVYIEGLRTGTWFDKPKDTDVYEEALACIDQIALDEAASRTVMLEYVQYHEERSSSDE